VEQVLLHKKRGVGGVPLEVLQEKRGVSLQLHVFLGAEFVELDVFGTVELERSWKNGSRAVPNTPLEFEVKLHVRDHKIRREAHSPEHPRVLSFIDTYT
jgi:hypothetical protein